MSQSSPRLVPSRGGRRGDSRTRLALDPPIKIAPFGGVWNRVWPGLDPLYRSFPGDGVLIVAIAAGRDLEAYLHVPLDDQRPAAQIPEFVVVGRHSACDLRLGGDDSISLRHLVISVQRQANELRVRLLDLGTDAGFVTEDGQRCSGLGADGAAFVGLGSYHLFVLPTGALAPLPWGGTAADAWAAIPERVYVDRRSAGAHAGRPPDMGHRGPRDGRSIATQLLDPPTALRQRKLAPGARGPKVGTLTLGVGTAVESYDVHAADLVRGLLIGRYERCAFGAVDERLSRVHLLIVRDGDNCWAVDTASSNGTTAGEQRIRQSQLGPDLRLARAMTLAWTEDLPVDQTARDLSPVASDTEPDRPI
jgi:hypothetical protein